MSDLVLGSLMAALAVGGGVVVHEARKRRLKAGSVRVLAAACAVGLLAMIVTDWPAEVLSAFWAGHSVLASVLSTVLLVGVVFFLYEYAEQGRQDALDNGVTGAGLGGVVDHVVDVEVALALLSATHPPDPAHWGDWDREDKPLRWLRKDRSRLARQGLGVSDSDPRCLSVELPGMANPDWRLALVDQCVRRTLSGMRDWSPLIGASENGVQALLALSEVRKDLMRLENLLVRGDRSSSTALLTSLRQRLRILAHFFETLSGADPLRDEVLLTFDPLPAPQGRVTWSAGKARGDVFTREWQRDLERSICVLAASPHVA